MFWGAYVLKPHLFTRPQSQVFFIVLTKPLPGQSGLVPGEITDSAGLFSPKYSAQPCRKTGGSLIKVQDAEIPKYVQNTQICTKYPNMYKHLPTFSKDCIFVKLNPAIGEAWSLIRTFPSLNPQSIIVLLIVLPTEYNSAALMLTA